MRKNRNDKSEFRQALLLENITWTLKITSRSRYATHNNYVGFKRIVHDALHPGDDAPPVPHPDTWFPESPHASNSGQARTRNARNHHQTDADLSDDDIAIAREKTSLKCPITLLPFRDPVTSKKCPHSFEKEAILSMISQSGARVGGMRRGEGERAVKCPVCEQVCEYSLSLATSCPKPFFYTGHKCD